MTATPKRFLAQVKECERWFPSCPPVHQAVRRLTQELEGCGIEYAVMGGLTVVAHGANGSIDDIDLLLTADGLARFRERFVGTTLDPVPQHWRRFSDRATRATIDVRTCDYHPHLRGSPQFPYPLPREGSERIDEVQVLTLTNLIQLKLGIRRYRDVADVVRLIRAHEPDGSFTERLDPRVHEIYLKALDEKRRDDLFDSRED